MTRPLRTEAEEVEYYRYGFLELVSERAPHVLEALSARMAAAEPFLDPESVERLHEPEGEPLRAILAPWAAEQHLEAPWILETAAETLRDWTQEPELAGRYWSYPARDADSSEIHFGAINSPAPPPGFPPALATPAGLYTRDEALELQAEYHDRQAEALKAGGWHEVTRREQSRHLEWLFRYQVLREPWPAIAEAANYTEDNVQRRVKRMAALIGLELDPVRPPGRPKAPRTRRIAGAVNYGFSRPPHASGFFSGVTVSRLTPGSQKDPGGLNGTERMDGPGGR